MATPFRRPWVSWRVVSSIGELRGCTISGNMKHAGQATATIPRSIGDGPAEIQRHPMSFMALNIPTSHSYRPRRHCTPSPSSDEEPADAVVLPPELLPLLHYLRSHSGKLHPPAVPCVLFFFSRNICAITAPLPTTRLARMRYPLCSRRPFRRWRRSTILSRQASGRREGGRPGRRCVKTWRRWNRWTFSSSGSRLAQSASPLQLAQRFRRRRLELRVCCRFRR